MAGLADQHLLGFPPREFEDFRRHQIVEQDDVGGVQGTHRAQRQQLRVAGPGADQRHPPGAGRGIGAGDGEQGIEIAGRGIAIGIVHGGGGEQLPEAPARRERQVGRLHQHAPAARSLGPAGKAARQQAFDLAADRLGEHRRGAVGRDADHQRRPVDDGTEYEIAQPRLVDDVDGNAGTAGRRGEPFCLRIIGHGADRDRGAREVAGLPGPFLDRNRTLRRFGGERAQLFAGRIREYLHAGARSRQQLRLPCRGGRISGDHHPFALERQEYRQPRQRTHPRARLLGVAERDRFEAAGHRHRSPVEQRGRRRMKWLVMELRWFMLPPFLAVSRTPAGRANAVPSGRQAPIKANPPCFDAWLGRAAGMCLIPRQAAAVPGPRPGAAQVRAGGGAPRPGSYCLRSRFTANTGLTERRAAVLPRQAGNAAGKPKKNAP